MFKFTRKDDGCHSYHAYVSPRQILKYLKSLPANHKFYMDDTSKCLFAQYFYFKTQEHGETDANVVVGIELLHIREENDSKYRAFKLPAWTVYFQLSPSIRFKKISSASDLIGVISNMLKDSSVTV